MTRLEEIENWLAVYSKASYWGSETQFTAERALLYALDCYRARVAVLEEALTELQMSAGTLTMWPFNLKHASDGQYDTFCEQKIDYERADFWAKKVIRLTPEQCLERMKGDDA